MVEMEEYTESFKEDKPKCRRVITSNHDSVVLNRQNFKRTLLCKAKPSYLLGLGPKASRSDYLNRLPSILRELLRRRNWSDASRVLSVLMQGTIKNHCPKMNRLKYEAHIQILNHLETKESKADEIGRIYDTWIGQIGKQHKEEKLLVWFEQICHFIENDMNSEAYSAVISLMQNRDFAMLTRANLFIGITFYKMWCSRFMQELQPYDSDCSESISNMSKSRCDSLVKSTVRDESVNSVESEVSARNDSETSVMNYKKISRMSISDSGTTMDQKVKLQSVQEFTIPPRLYASSEENEASTQEEVAFDPTLIKIIGDMDPWLLPLRPPEDPDCYRKVINDSYYKEAVRYLRLTVHSRPQVSLAALHPLVQLLLIGGHVDETMKVVEKICDKVHDIKPFRIKAFMMEKFHRNSDMLAKCYEDILKIDPSCVTTLKKLIEMCMEDEYSRESLIEMIALQIEASFPEPKIWKELASCFSYFENLNEDRMSVCLNGSEDQPIRQTYSVRYNQTPTIFANTAWTLRATSWLNCHFLPEKLETDIKDSILTGDWEMMSYKAACASHMYGPDFGYVTEVYNQLKKSSNNKDFFNFLQEHRNYNRIFDL